MDFKLRTVVCFMTVSSAINFVFFQPVLVIDRGWLKDESCTCLCKGLWQVFGGLHNLKDALLIHAQLCGLGQRVGDGQLD